MRSRACGSLVFVLLALARLWAQTTDYAVTAQDVVTITVFGHTQLSGKYVVEGDGTIAFPMVGRVRVGGLATRDVEREITRHLADGYLKEPQVSVSVDRFRPQQVFVIGEVRQPGAFPLAGGMTVLEALARAGSVTADAADEAIVIRPVVAPPPPTTASSGGSPGTAVEPPDADVLIVNLAQLARGVLTQNLVLASGDTLLIKRVDTVYVLGQVKTPGPYPARTDTTVLQAISMAGGATDRGSLGRVRVTRIINGKPQQIKVNLGDFVRPGDTITVLERIL